jgi:hypothetical protein
MGEMPDGVSPPEGGKEDFSEFWKVTGIFLLIPVIKICPDTRILSRTQEFWGNELFKDNALWLRVLCKYPEMRCPTLPLLIQGWRSPPSVFWVAELGLWNCYGGWGRARSPPPHSFLFGKVLHKYETRFFAAQLDGEVFRRKSAPPM